MSQDGKQNDAELEAKDNDNNKKLLMIVGDFGEDYEIMVPFQTLLAFGYTVHAICPNKKKGDKIVTAVHDFENGIQTYVESRGHNFELNESFDNIYKNNLYKNNNYIGLILPGGRAPEYLSINDNVIEIVTHFSENNLAIASVCHGQLILAAANVIKNKKCTAYPACMPVLKQCNAIWQSPNPITKAFSDGNLVTAAAWPGHPEWISQFINALNGKIENCNKKRILIIAGDFVEDYELMIPYQALLSFGFNVDCICPNKKMGDKIVTAIHDFEDGIQTYTEKKGHKFEINATFDDIYDKLCKNNNDNSGKEDIYDGLYIPGGRAPEYLSINDKVLEMVKYFFDNKKSVASICHGQLILAAANVIKDKKCTAYPACKPAIVGSGSQWLEPNPITKAFTDGNLVTGAAWPAHPQLLQQFVQVLGGKLTP